MPEMPIKVDAVANLNPLVKEGAGLVASLNKGVAKIFSALFQEDTILGVSDSKLGR